MGLRPRPVRQPRPPIWIGGSSPAALRRAARYGDGWLPQSLGPNLELLATLRALREEHRGGAPIDVGAISHTLLVGEAPDGLPVPPGTVAGSPDRLSEYLGEYVDAGIGQIQVRFPSRSADELCDQISAFGEQVIPLVGS